MESLLFVTQALEGARSLEEVTAAHSRFVVAVQRQCLLAPDKTWKLIEGVVVQILNQMLHGAAQKCVLAFKDVCWHTGNQGVSGRCQSRA